ncbi:MAG: PBP1A family penicillin-binding protein [Pseudomonadota bacterium]
MTTPKKPKDKRGKPARAKKDDPGRIGRAVRFLVLGLLRLGWRIGWRVSLLAAFVLGGATLYYYSTLPEPADLFDGRGTGSVTLTDRDGNVFAWRGEQYGGELRADDVSPHLIHAVIATEDKRFWHHIGIDPRGIARAMVANIQAGRLVQGGSTLTQQVAKNVFLTAERSLERKLKELPMALALEWKYSKDEILSIYLNRVYLGAGTYGFEAASRRYFGKSARGLNPAESAMLAGLLRAPSRYAPTAGLERARDRAAVIVRLMEEQGYLSEAQVVTALTAPASLSDAAAAKLGGAFADWVIETLPPYVDTKVDLTIATTFDARAQRAAEAGVDRVFAEKVKEGSVAQAAVVVMSPDGAVRAMVGGHNDGSGRFNRATQALRQTGSAFKPVVYAAALEAGMSPRDVIEDRPLTIRGWSPKNYNRRYRGRVSMTVALQKSINTVPVHIAQSIGRKAIIDNARLVGLDAELRSNASMPLGTNEVTVLDITGAYATFANGGRLTKPHAVLEIRRPNGDLLYSRSNNERDTKQVVSPGKVADLNYMLNQVVVGGTGRRSELGFTPQAGKTGTTQGYRDAWFIGFTAHYATGVWYGNDDFTPTNRLTGGNLPAMTWKEVMSKALETQVAQALPGVPLDGRYARFTGNNDVQIPIAAASTEQTDQGGEVTIITSPERKQGGVANTVRQIFNIFENQKQKNRVRQVRTVTVETRQKRREQRIERRKQRNQQTRAQQRLLNNDSRR